MFYLLKDPKMRTYAIKKASNLKTIQSEKSSKEKTLNSLNSEIKHLEEERTILRKEITEIRKQKTEFMDGRYTLNWDMSSDEDFGSYEIERSSSPTMEQPDILFTSTRSLDTTFIDTDLDFLAHNYYRIIVTDTLGFKSVGPVHRSDLYPLPFPADISTISYNLDSMAVEWTLSKGENFIEYRLLSAYSEDGPKKIEAIYDDINVNKHILTEFDLLASVVV